MKGREGARCPHCGAALGHADEPDTSSGGIDRYDLERLVAQARNEKAYDETDKVRVTQEDIRKLVEKRRKKPK